MHEVPLKYREAVNTYQSVDFEGMELFPITVREYEEFAVARSAVDIVQQSLPVRYLSMPLLSAYYALDREQVQKGEKPLGFFKRAMLFLVLSLHYREDLKTGERLKEFVKGVRISADDPNVLKAIVFVQDGKEKKLTPVQFQRMRSILAAQNGIELENENANVELLEAQRDLSEANGPKLVYDIHTMVTAMCAFSNLDEKDVYQWPIAKLTKRYQAYDRLFSHLIYGFATASGTKFKGGNPVPSAFFERAEKENDVLVDISSITGGKPIQVTTPGASPT